MDGFDGLFVFGRDAELRPPGGVFTIAVNGFFVLFHGRYTWGGGLIVQQHGHLEIVRREHHGDVGEMLADLVAALGVSHVIRFHWNDAAGVCEQEVVGRLLVGKAHGLVATRVDGVVVPVMLPEQGRCGERSD